VTDETLPDRLVDRVTHLTDAIPSPGEVGSAISEAISQVGDRLLHRQAEAAPADPVGQPVDPDTRIIKPPKNGKTFYGWRDDRWVPIHREHGAGWVWSE
jgi:hypothetical protein